MSLTLTEAEVYAIGCGMRSLEVTLERIDPADTEATRHAANVIGILDRLLDRIPKEKDA